MLFVLYQNSCREEGAGRASQEHEKAGVAGARSRIRGPDF